MNGTLTLNDGTVLGGHCIESDGTLWLYLDKAALGELFPLLDDPEKTKVIKAAQYGTETTIRGYKHLFCIREETNQVTAGLREK